MSRTAGIGIRVHSIECLPKLHDALWACAGQDYAEVNVIVACQGFDEQELSQVESLLAGPSRVGQMRTSVVNLPNPDGKDLRSALLNKIVEHAYDHGDMRYLLFLDYDDVIFSHAVTTLVDALDQSGAALAYASIQAANIWEYEQFSFLLEMRDVYQIANRTKQDIIQGNFLPIHSYMFDLQKISRDDLVYDESLTRTEDYELLLRLATKYPWSPIASRRLIGLYNFYSQAQSADFSAAVSNTSRNVFDLSDADHSEEWVENMRVIRSKLGRLSPKFFYSDFWN